jgi:hypothetical protein
MNGVWFAAMIAGLMVAGVAAQLGWQLPQMAEVKRVFRLDRQRSAMESARASTPAVVADPR